MGEAAGWIGWAVAAVALLTLAWLVREGGALARLLRQARTPQPEVAERMREVAGYLCGDCAYTGASPIEVANLLRQGADAIGYAAPAPGAAAHQDALREALEAARLGDMVAELAHIAADFEQDGTPDHAQNVRAMVSALDRVRATLNPEARP